MAIHRVPRATLHEDLIDIERRQCEKVNTIMIDPNDSGFMIVYTDTDYIERRTA